MQYWKGLEKLNRTDKVTKLSQESDSGQIYPDSAVRGKLTVLNTSLEETVYHTRSSMQNWKGLQKELGRRRIQIIDDLKLKRRDCALTEEVRGEKFADRVKVSTVSTYT